jgi:Na+-transporting NADH:ubiquinone oxidoreductase subunit C
MKQHSNAYIIGFAAGVCLVCSIFVATSAVALKERQEQNKVLDRQKKVLIVAGLMEEGQSISAQDVQALFDENIKIRAIDLETGDFDDSVDVGAYDQRKATKDPSLSRMAPANNAGIPRQPLKVLIYERVDGDDVVLLILPIEGKGLWSTLYGFLALAPDTKTIEGLTFYEHGETPGLGGEIDNPRWKGLWKDRVAFDDEGNPEIEVIKGAAGPPDTDPHRVDGLSGATLTGRGVTHLIQFWLSNDGYGPFLEKFRAERSAT